MKRWTQIALLGVVILAVASLAAAQGTLQVPSGTPQPTMRFGNFIEVGNDVLMHIIATTQFVYNTTTNFDFTNHSILKFFQVDSAGRCRMTSSARYFNKGVGSSRPHGRWIMCFLERPKANTSCTAWVKRCSFS